MGVKGLFTCIKPYSHEVNVQQEPPKRMALDMYPFLYRFKQDIHGCIELLQKLQKAGHTLTLYLDGLPPKEKMEELASRKQQKEQAWQQASALKEFLKSKEADLLDEKARDVILQKIAAFEVESYSVKKELRETFVKRIEADCGIQVVHCKGEADSDLIQASVRNEVDVVIANDMDLFVGGVECLWILGKNPSEPLFLEFRRSAISKELGIHAKAWTDVAILAGYEKTPELKRCSANQAIVWIRYYGCLENLFARRRDLLQGKSEQEYYDARKFFSL
jgi:5'-3' exonuclease